MAIDPKRTCIVVCALLLVASATHVSAAVTFSDTLTDPAGDVVNLTQNPAPGHTEVDIITITSAEQGTDVNVTLTLAGGYNASASYTVTVLADGTMNDYSFSYLMFLGFTASKPSGAIIASVDGYSSADGKKLSWVVPKSEIVATTSWKIGGASAMHMDMTNISDLKTYMDTATAPVGPGPGPTPEPEEGPSHMEILYEFVSITHVRMTVSTWLEGNNSLLVRMGMDEDEDGNVTAAEKMKAVNDIAKYMTTSTNMTLDGAKGTEADAFDYVGAVGKTDSKATLRMTVVTDITFPEPAAASSHVYMTPQDSSSSSGDGFGNVTDNSSFKITAQSGWRFVEAEWPSSITPFFDTGRSTIDVHGKDFKAAFAGTFPANITLEKSGGGGGGGDKKGFLPGAGPLAALAALAVPVVLLARARRRT